MSKSSEVNCDQFSLWDDTVCDVKWNNEGDDDKSLGMAMDRALRIVINLVVQCEKSAGTPATERALSRLFNIVTRMRLPPSSPPVSETAEDTLNSEEWLAIRKEEALWIDPKTAEVTQA